MTMVKAMSTPALLPKHAPLAFSNRSHQGQEGYYQGQEGRSFPGAFTPTCSQKHPLGFVEKANELRVKGIDTIACTSDDDAFVMRAWGESLGVGNKVLLLSDGNLAFTGAIGATFDLNDKPVGVGVPSRRYSLLADDGVVRVLHLEEGRSFTSSGSKLCSPSI
ncbi:hypothetical protein L7F22_055838 [Adiantum nelumboides]|nr:hypothetical protein [Adiantum nelumboides]